MPNDARSGYVRFFYFLQVYPAAAPQITAAYNSLLGPSGRGSSEDILPIVQFRTSDTSNEAATLMAMLKRGTSVIPLCCVKVYHTPPLEFDENNVRLTPMSLFRRESGMLFAKMETELM